MSSTSGQDEEKKVAANQPNGMKKKGKKRRKNKTKSIRSESGRTTIMKQMKTLNTRGFSKEERRKFKIIVHGNVLDSIYALVKAVETHALQYSSAEIFEYAQKIEESCSAYAETEQWYPDPTGLLTSMLEEIKLLWSDSAIQDAYELRSTFRLIDSAKYFLNNLDRIGGDYYEPADEDILQARVPSLTHRRQATRHKPVYQMANSEADLLNNWKLRCPKEKEAVLYHGEYVAILETLPDGSVLLDKEVNGKIVEVGQNQMFWVPRGFWKLNSDHTSEDQQLSPHKSIHRTTSDLNVYISNDTFESDFLLASKNRVIEENIKHTVGSFPKWSTIDNGIPFKIFDDDEEYVVTKEKREIQLNLDQEKYLTESFTERQTYIPSLPQTRRILDLRVHKVPTIVLDESPRADNTFMTSVPSHRESESKELIEDNLTVELEEPIPTAPDTRLDMGPLVLNMDPRVSLLPKLDVSTNFMTENHSGANLSVPENLILSPPNKSSMHTRSSLPSFSRKESVKNWRPIPQKTQFVVPNPFQKHPYAISKKPHEVPTKTVSPMYTHAFQTQLRPQPIVQGSMIMSAVASPPCIMDHFRPPKRVTTVMRRLAIPHQPRSSSPLLLNYSQ